MKEPVYSLSAFSGETEIPFYANELRDHLRSHKFVNKPHRHDFYMTLLITHGEGQHMIDFRRYQVRAGTVFFMQPGQAHSWRFSKDIEGWIFFHSRDFYESSGLQLKDLPYFHSAGRRPLLRLRNKRIYSDMHRNMRRIAREAAGSHLHKKDLLYALIRVVYLDLAAAYRSPAPLATRTYLQHYNEFTGLVDQHYLYRRSPGTYAAMMNITEKHLNRIARLCVNKTSTQIIADRVLLEAKRLLLSPDHEKKRLQVGDVSEMLGFSDISYFTRFFRKHAGVSPGSFSEQAS